MTIVDRFRGTAPSSSPSTHGRTPTVVSGAWREGDPVWYGDTPARHEAIPVRRRDETDIEEGFSEVIAVIGRDTNLSTARTPSQRWAFFTRAPLVTSPGKGRPAVVPSR